MSDNQIILEDNQLVCSLTGEIKKISSIESNLQSVIIMINEEYGFDLDDMDRADRSKSRTPAGDSLIKVFKRTHDYIYGNEGRKKDAFWQYLSKSI